MEDIMITKYEISAYIRKWGGYETFKIVDKEVVIKDKSARYVASVGDYNLYINDFDEAYAAIFD